MASAEVLQCWLRPRALFFLPVLLLQPCVCCPTSRGRLHGCSRAREPGRTARWRQCRERPGCHPSCCEAGPARLRARREAVSHEPSELHPAASQPLYISQKAFRPQRVVAFSGEKKLRGRQRPAVPRSDVRHPAHSMQPHRVCGVPSWSTSLPMRSRVGPASAKTSPRWSLAQAQGCCSGFAVFCVSEQRFQEADPQEKKTSKFLAACER